jgi:hypothetical protein
MLSDGLSHIPILLEIKKDFNVEVAEKEVIERFETKSGIERAMNDDNV